MKYSWPGCITHAPFKKTNERQAHFLLLFSEGVVVSVRSEARSRGTKAMRVEALPPIGFGRWVKKTSSDALVPDPSSIKDFWTAWLKDHPLNEFHDSSWPLERIIPLQLWGG